MRYSRSRFDFLFTEQMDCAKAVQQMKCTLLKEGRGLNAESDTVRLSPQAQQKNHVPNSSGPDINHPLVFTTKPGLASQRIDAWEMLTSCWDQCSGLLWSSQGCVVSAELL